jgi:hypothetical protein
MSRNPEEPVYNRIEEARAALPSMVMAWRERDI